MYVNLMKYIALLQIGESMGVKADTSRMARSARRKDPRRATLQGPECSLAGTLASTLSRLTALRAARPASLIDSE